MVLKNVGDVSPPPVQEWNMRVSNAITRLSTIKTGASKAEIGDAVQDIAEAVGQAELVVRKRIGEDAFAVLSQMFQESSISVLEQVKAYFILPIQRIITNYNTDIIRVHRQYQLSQDHQYDITTFLKNHMKISASINRETLGEFGLAKYRYFIDQMTSILKIASELRSSRIPYGAYILPYILRALIMGPLSELLDPNQVPVTATEIAGLTAGKSVKSIQVTIKALIQQILKERLSYSPEIVREKIAKADEREKEGIIGEFDKLGDDDKKLEKIRETLGMGKWAIGGTKLIYAYDQDQYDKEREARMSKYPTDGAGPEGGPYAEGQEDKQGDKYGIFSFGGEGKKREAGYEFIFYDEAEAE
jgi:hypothetical protein